jgi:hypothetical protein
MFDGKFDKWQIINIATAQNLGVNLQNFIAEIYTTGSNPCSHMV